MVKPSCPSFSAVAVVLLVTFMIAQESHAKSGCASFGHSCYGGIGKRGDLANGNEETVQSSAQDSNIGYQFAEPRAPSANIARPYRYNRLSPEQNEQMNKLVREWVINYLKKEDELERK